MVLWISHYDDMKYEMVLSISEYAGIQILSTMKKAEYITMVVQ